MPVISIVRSIGTQAIGTSVCTPAIHTVTTFILVRHASTPCTVGATAGTATVTGRGIMVATTVPDEVMMGQACATDSTVVTITTAVVRLATARVALSPPMTIRQEATDRVVVAVTTLHPTAVVAALATDRAARVPPLPNRVRSVMAVEVVAALDVMNRQALGRPYRTVRSRPTHPRHPEALHQAGLIVLHREAIVHRQGVLPQVVPTAHHREAIVHHPGTILHPAALTVRHQGAIVHHQGQVAIRGEHKVAAEVLEAVGD